jgi:hypothetical protein
MTDEVESGSTVEDDNVRHRDSEGDELPDASHVEAPEAGVRANTPRERSLSLTFQALLVLANLLVAYFAGSAFYQSSQELRRIHTPDHNLIASIIGFTFVSAPSERLVLEVAFQNRGNQQELIHSMSFELPDKMGEMWPGKDRQFLSPLVVNPGDVRLVHFVQPVDAQAIAALPKLNPRLYDNLDSIDVNLRVAHLDAGGFPVAQKIPLGKLDVSGKTIRGCLSYSYKPIDLSATPASEDTLFTREFALRRNRFASDSTFITK